MDEWTPCCSLKPAGKVGKQKVSVLSDFRGLFFIHIHNIFLSYSSLLPSPNSSHTSPTHLLVYFLFGLKYIPPSLTNAVSMWTGVGPSTGAWETYQWLHSQRKKIILPFQVVINGHNSSHLNFDWPDLVWVLCR